ncbi:DUF4334 domain-containing protein [Ramlibacter algicola]|uniref:DUF4334 domain-containing protein n=1 Tax=Ramlibacter algicola TaxID=2795217 RepID=A0A934URR6_9BURK|nr:DUF4334 domain-containing protein [Ramlibacter algicola]MBK0392812.1 DUF4334 domain-containing protein [Ramlibacter algicola]
MHDGTDRRGRSAAEALALFDSLPRVDGRELEGFWRGEGFPTGHPLDGLLEACGWLGKRFDGAERVQPLVMSTWLGVRAIRPSGALLGSRLVMRWPQLKVLGRIARVLFPLVATRQPQARLRQMEHRGVVTATIVYDRVPIQDALRRLDRDTLLGMMDCRGVEPPLFFVLKRSSSPV